MSFISRDAARVGGYQDADTATQNDRQFTFPEDVHDAFLGMAKQFVPFFPGGLWLGLPVRHLTTWLLWTGLETTERRRTSGRTRSQGTVTPPSW